MNRRTTLPLILAPLLALPGVAAAQEQAAPRIVVTGEGESTMKPDMALLSLGVMREAPTAGEALAQNSTAMAAVLAAMKESGIAERDLQTAGIQISPRYEYTQKPDGTQEGKLVAYQVVNTVSVRIRDIAKTGEVIDKAVALGVNSGGGITFTNVDPKPALEEARRQAVRDAFAKARVLAEAAQVSLGRVLEISDTAMAAPPVPILAKAMEAQPVTPVEAGENSYQVQVNVTFELK